MASGREVFNDEKVLLVMVGLPARGKSFISHKMTNFLSWCVSLNVPIVISWSGLTRGDAPTAAGWASRQTYSTSGRCAAACRSRSTASSSLTPATRRPSSSARSSPSACWMLRSSGSVRLVAMLLPRFAVDAHVLLGAHVAAAGGEVAIFDATNTTRHRRLQVQEHCRNHATDVQIIFIESICDDARVGGLTCSRLLSSCT
jgi:hypothetical protein